MLRFHALLDGNATWPSCEGGSRNGTTCSIGCNSGYAGGLTSTCVRGSWTIPVGCCTAANESSANGSTCVNAANFTLIGGNVSTATPSPSPSMQGMQKPCTSLVPLLFVLGLATNLCGGRSMFHAFLAGKQHSVPWFVSLPERPS
jgi:hypothetical protein